MAVATPPNTSTMAATFAHSRCDGEASACVTTIHPAEDGSGDLTDLRIAAGSCPALFFSIPLTEESLVTIHFQELNSASRCVLLLSPRDPHPSEETAVWRLMSPDPVKRLVVHPADDNYPRNGGGSLYLAVRYLEGNGSTFVNLGVRLRPLFYSVWYHREVLRVLGESGGSSTKAVSLPKQSNNSSKGGSSYGGSHGSPFFSSSSSPKAERYAFTGTSQTLPNQPSQDGAVPDSEEGDRRGTVTLSSSLYIGAWLGRHRHGRGVCFYATAPLPSHEPGTRTGGKDPMAFNGTTPASLLLLQAIHERRCLPWSALSLPESPALDDTPLDAKFIAKITGLLDTRDAESVSFAGSVSSSFSSQNRSAGAAAEAEAEAEAAEGERGEGKGENEGRAEDEEVVEAPGGSDVSLTEAGKRPPVWRVIGAPISDDGLEAYDGEWVYGRKEGHGVYQWADRAYVGEWHQGQRHGKGELRCASGAYYRGEWRNDKRDGFGEALFVPEGNIYRGHWRQGLQDGPGSLRYSNGVVVSCNWVNGALEPGAVVTAVYPDGTRYSGAWKDDCRHGQGYCTDAKGCVHEHTWDRDQRQGSGVIRLRNGVRFEGEWHCDELLQGTYSFPDGDAYQGDWDSEKDVRVGHGTCRSKNGDVYEGEWKDDMRHGHGTMHYANGAVYKGSWASTLPDGEGRLEDEEGVYEGSFERGLRCGFGVQANPDGSVYKGHWRNNYRAGYGTQYDAKRDITYTGIFLHDRLQGQGGSAKQLDDGQEVYSGTWLDGMEQGRGTLRLPSGDVMRGVWHRGVQVDGKVELRSADGGVYVGDWCGGVRSGHGTQVYADSAAVYEGEWRHDRPHGRGRLTRVNGESVECSWEDGNMVDSSTGTVEFVDGSVYVGEMKQGVPHGQGTLTYLDVTTFQGTFENGFYRL